MTNHGIIDGTRTEIRQIFSRMSVTAKNLESCLPLLEMKWLLMLDVSSTPVVLNTRFKC